MPSRTEANTKKEVRVQIIHEDKIVATPKGLEISNSVITWDWLMKARAACVPDAPFQIVKDVRVTAPSTKVKKAKTKVKASHTSKNPKSN